MKTKYDNEITKIEELMKEIESLKWDIQEKEQDLHNNNKATKLCCSSIRELHSLIEHLQNSNVVL